MLQRQRELHPDKFSSRGSVVVQLARDLSGRVNDAYSVLADPLKRAEYIVRFHISLVPARIPLDLTNPWCSDHLTVVGNGIDLEELMSCSFLYMIMRRRKKIH